MAYATSFTATTKAWTTSPWQDLAEVQHMISNGQDRRAIDTMSFVGHDMSNTEGWVEVGTAEITVTFFPKDQIVAKELEGLNAQLQAVRAENQERENAILDRISKLTAIEFTPGEPS